MIDEPRSNSIQFCFKQTWCGIVLMVRDTVPASAPGVFYWTSWRKAKFNELPIYQHQLRDTQ